MLLVAQNGLDIAPYPLGDLMLERGSVAGLTLVQRGPSFRDFAARAMKAIDERTGRVPPGRREYWRTYLAGWLDRDVQGLLPGPPVVIRVEGAPHAARSLMLRQRASGSLMLLIRDACGRIYDLDPKDQVTGNYLFLRTLFEAQQQPGRPYGQACIAPTRWLAEPPLLGRRQLKGVARAERELGDLLELVREQLLRPYAEACRADVAAFAGVSAPALQHAMTLHRDDQATVVSLYQGATDDLTLHYRHQALQLFPAVVACFREHGTGPARERTVRVNRFGPVEHCPRAMPAFFPAVDAGEPVIDAMARQASLPRWAMDAALRMPPEVVGQFSGEVDRAAHVVATLSPDRLPKLYADWNALAEAYNRPALAKPMFGSIMQRGFKPLRRLLASDEGKELLVYASWVDHLFGGCESPRGASAYDWLGAPTLRESLKLSRAWGRANQRATEVFGPRTDRWPPLFPEPVRFGGYQFVSLSTSVELAAEAEAMENCLAGYVQQCATGSAHIISVRKRDQPIATLQLAVDTAAWPTVNLEHVAGVADTEVPPALENKIHELVEKICAGSIALNGEVRTFEYPHRVFEPGHQGLLKAVIGVRGREGLELYRDALELAPGRGQMLATVWKALQKYAPREAGS